MILAHIARSRMNKTGFGVVMTRAGNASMTSTLQAADRKPLVSVVMANRNGALFLPRAILSVLAQSEADWELIVSDDASNDASLALLEALAKNDPRIRILCYAQPTGPGAARNRALDVARGEWLLVLDSDDDMHPDRMSHLLAHAEAHEADIIADNQLWFYADPHRASHILLAPAFFKPGQNQPARFLEAEEFIRCNHFFGNHVLGANFLHPRPSLGYLKPMIRRSRLIEHAIRYDEDLPIGEDYDLILRLLQAKARLAIHPLPLYFYRKHGQSSSYRSPLPAIDALIEHAARLARALHWNAGEENALRARERSLRQARNFTASAEALKAGDWRQALQILAGDPVSMRLFAVPFYDRIMGSFSQILRLTLKEAAPQNRVAFLSRQRIEGAHNGSSTYLLALARELRAQGYALDFIGASARIFGRRPFLWLQAECDVFASFRVVQSWRIGRLVLARDWRIYRAAIAAILARKLPWLRRLRPDWDQKAAYSVAADPNPADCAFVARHVRDQTRIILADYAFLTPMRAFALRPDIPMITLMHDLFSARIGQQNDQSSPHAQSQMSPARERALLAPSDAILAIQPSECAAVQAWFPGKSVLLTPCHANIVSQAQPGRDNSILFVGSSTAPNVLGINWFLEEVWPRLRAQNPLMELQIAGSVCACIEAHPGVRRLGLVRDLAPLIRECGVVIVPLHSGSGLKIKLVEAMAAGKALVGTSIAAQGIEDWAAQAMVVADGQEEFAAAVMALAQSASLRKERGARALHAAAQHFSADRTFGPLRDFLGQKIAVERRRDAPGLTGPSPHERAPAPITRAQPSPVPES